MAIWNFSGGENPWLNNDKADPYEGLNWFQKANKMAKEGLLNAGVAESSYMNNPFIGGVAHVSPTKNDREIIVDHAAGGVIRPTDEKDLWRSIFGKFPRNPGGMKTFTNPKTGETKRGIDNIQWEHFDQHKDLNPQDFKDQQIKNVFNQAAALDFLQKFNPFA